MSAPKSNPLRVAECTGCGQLFAVYEAAGEVACPACSTVNAVQSLEVAELPVATSITAEAKAPGPEPTPVEPVAAEPILAEREAPAEPTQTEPQAERPPTVAEWLVQSEAESKPAPPAEPAAEPTTAELAPKPSLSESLGWNPGSFRLDGAEPSHTEEPTAEATTPEPLPMEPIRKPQPAGGRDEFKFDLGTTPLSEHASEDAPQLEELITPSIGAAEPIETTGLDLEANDDTPQAAEYDWTQVDSEPRRGWFGPVTAVAGLLAVAAPLVYLGWDSFGEGVVAASDNRETRASLAEVMAEDEPPIPWEEPAELPAETAKAEPIIVDPATQPASFNADELASPAVNEAAAASEAEPSSPPIDPFNAPLPESSEPSAPAEESASVYASNPPAEDRYATQASATEPATAFEPPPFDEPGLEEQNGLPPAAEPAFQPAPAERRVGLVNAPTYGVGELTEAMTAATAAGRAFANGTLADPEQVQAMGQNYARLCHLAQVLTLFEPDASDPSRLTAELEAADVFTRLFSQGQPREESRQIAGPWIGWTGRPHGGVFFAGQPENMTMPGEVVQYDFRLGEKVVPVVFAEKLSINRFVTAKAKEIGVIGIVVENPRQWIAGYDGTAERVVWARKTLTLREPKQL